MGLLMRRHYPKPVEEQPKKTVDPDISKKDEVKAGDPEKRARRRRG